jgi:hypothetical protein
VVVQIVPFFLGMISLALHRELVLLVNNTCTLAIIHVRFMPFAFHVRERKCMTDYMQTIAPWHSDKVKLYQQFG